MEVTTVARLSVNDTHTGVTPTFLHKICYNKARNMVDQVQKEPFKEKASEPIEAPVEKPEAVEVAKPEEEKVPEAKVEVSKEKIPAEVAEVARKAAPPPTPTAPARDELTEQIEDILSLDLEEMYKQMPPDRQQLFKKVGEETAIKIHDMLKSGKVKVHKIVDLIKNWLKIIPGVNKFFLEQEAKIKTDKILFLAEEKKRQEEEV